MTDCALSAAGTEGGEAVGAARGRPGERDHPDGGVRPPVLELLALEPFSGSRCGMVVLMGGADGRRGRALGTTCRVCLFAAVAWIVGCASPGGEADGGLGDGSRGGGRDAGRDGRVERPDGSPTDAEPDARLDASVAPPPLPDCERDPLQELQRDTIDPPGRGSGDYSIPPKTARDRLLASVQAWADGRGERAETHAAEAGYLLCRGGSDGAQVVWRPLEGGTGHAVLIVREDEATPVVLQAPHPLYDTNTLEQSAALFTSLRARAVVVSGTHRCASEVASGCDGTSATCASGDERIPYTESDMAHTEQSFFHSAHEALAGLYPEAVFISVHGMSGDGVSISDGTRQDTTADSLVAHLASAFREVMPDDRVSTCNDYPGAPDVASRLCGTTNVQGRQLNGSLVACTEPADRASGRFIHMEQTRELRDAPFERVTSALSRVLLRD